MNTPRWLQAAGLLAAVFEYRREDSTQSTPARTADRRVVPVGTLPMASKSSPQRARSALATKG